jgi:cellulose synthase operon protein B
MSFANYRLVKIVAFTVLLLASLAEAEPLSLMVDDEPQIIERHFLLSDLGYSASIELQGSKSDTYIGFGSRLDEVITGGELDLSFISSPALQSKFSHLKVYFNQELMKVVPVEEGTQGDVVESKIPLDSRFFSNYNQIRIELIGHLDLECWNPDDQSIWAEISKNSSLHVTSRKIRLQNDLGFLPAPFFDAREFTKLVLPIVVPDSPSMELIKAAGISASYFGALSQWRGAEFPVHVNTLPDQHALVFMTNDERPGFLKDYPPVNKPTLQVISDPENPYVKLLLIMGSDTDELLTAVKGLALGNSVLSGSLAEINHALQVKPRKPYDAPAWVRTDRPVLFSELVKDKQDLQVTGRYGMPINITLQLPPDLFTWRSRGIPMDLRYRYSPPAEDYDGSRMSVSINKQFVEAFNLNKSGISGGEKRVRIPLLEDRFSDGDLVRIPAFKVGSKNQLGFQFAFTSVTNGACKTLPAEAPQAVMDGSSSVDFSGYPHYIEMPSLRAFANAGFPFTRLADLSETVVVLPQNLTKVEIETFLQILGFIGASSGYPAVAVDVVNSWDPARLHKKDILAISVTPALSKAMNDDDALPMILNETERTMLSPVRNRQSSLNIGENGRAVDNEVAENVNVSATGGLAAVVGAESPFSAGRSVIAVMAASTEDLAKVGAAFNDSGKIAAMFGSVAVFREDAVSSYLVGDRYYVGKLPIWQLIWYHFSEHPFVILLCALALIAMLVVVFWRILNQIAAMRLRAGEDE